jgi:hypothetical protein
MGKMFSFDFFFLNELIKEKRISQTSRQTFSSPLLMKMEKAKENLRDRRPE